MECASDCVVTGEIWIVLNNYKTGICGDNEEPELARFYLKNNMVEYRNMS